MHILCLDQFAEMGGGQRCLLDLLPAFLARGCTTEVLVPGPGPFAENIVQLAGSVRYFRANRLSSLRKPPKELALYAIDLRRAAMCLEQAIAVRSPGLIYVSGPRYLPAAAWIARRQRLPLLYHAHNWICQRTAIGLLRNSLRWCHADVIACCSYVAQSLRTAIAGRKLRIIYSGIADLRGGVAPRRGGPIQTLGILGRIAPEKGHLELLRALQLLGDRASSIRLKVIGCAASSTQDYYRAVQEEARGLRVDFSGWREDVSTAFKEIDLLLVPSRSYDAAPRVIPEAFSAGVPVLATPAGGIPELVDDRVSGFLARGTTADLIAQRIEEVLKLTAAELQHVAANARRRWEQQFSLDRYRRDVWSAVTSCARI